MPLYLIATKVHFFRPGMNLGNRGNDGNGGNHYLSERKRFRRFRDSYLALLPIMNLENDGYHFRVFAVSEIHTWPSWMSSLSPRPSISLYVYVSRSSLHLQVFLFSADEVLKLV